MKNALSYMFSSDTHTSHASLLNWNKNDAHNKHIQRAKNQEPCRKNKKNIIIFFACFLSQIRPVHWAGISVANF